MRSNARWAALGASLLLTTTLTACGGDGGADVEDDPNAALSEAIEALGDYDGVELGLAMVGDRDAIVASGLDEQTADLLLSSSIVIRAAGDDEDDAQAEFLINVSDQDVLEVRVLPEQRLFARVDLEALGDVVDDPDLVGNVDEALGMADAFGLGELASAVRSGDWIEVTGAEQLAELAGGAAGSTEEPSEDELEDVRERMVTALQRFLDEDVELTHVGSEEAGERITATTTEGDLAGLFQEVAAIAGDLGGVDADALGAEGLPDETSDTPVEIDFWIDGGELSQAGYDLSQIEGEEGPPAGTFIAVTIAEFGGGIEAPADATEVDLFALMGNLMGGMGAGLDGGEGVPGGEVEDGGAGDGGEDPFGAGCLDDETIEMMTGGDEDALAEIEQMIEMGVFERC